MILGCPRGHIPHLRLLSFGINPKFKKRDPMDFGLLEKLIKNSLFQFNNQVPILKNSF